jgi:hypothetical protein
VVHILLLLTVRQPLFVPSLVAMPVAPAASIHAIHCCFREYPGMRVNCFLHEAALVVKPGSRPAALEPAYNKIHTLA